jgi:hypothetical protein
MDVEDTLLAIIDMLTAALDKPQLPQPPRFSIVGNNCTVINNELHVIWALVQQAKPHGLRVQHILNFQFLVPRGDCFTAFVEQSW